MTINFSARDSSIHNINKISRHANRREDLSLEKLIIPESCSGKSNLENIPKPHIQQGGWRRHRKIYYYNKEDSKINHTREAVRIFFSAQKERMISLIGRIVKLITRTFRYKISVFNNFHYFRKRKEKSEEIYVKDTPLSAAQMVTTEYRTNSPYDIDLKCDELRRQIKESETPVYYQENIEKYKKALMIITSSDSWEAVDKNFSGGKIKKIINILNFPEIYESKIGNKKYPGQLIAGGVNGVYILKDRKGVPLTIFKPYDEGVGLPNNTKKKHDTDIIITRTGIRPENMPLREKAACYLDENFANVPSTEVVNFKNIRLNNSQPSKKEGSIQRFIPNAQPLVLERWSEYPTSDIHKIALRDLCWLNTDRHFENILFDDNKLYPIDHGLILPNKAGLLVFHWIDLPQASEELSSEEKQFVKDINVEQEIETLYKLGFKESEEAGAIQRMRIASKLVQIAIENGFFLADIAKLMMHGPSWVYRNDTWDTWQSYFENTICTRIITEGGDLEKILHEEIANFSLVLKNIRDPLKILEQFAIEIQRLERIDEKWTIPLIQTLRERYTHYEKISRTLKEQLP